MYYSRFESIKISEHFDSPPIFHEDGLKIYELAVTLFNKSERTKNNTLLTIDFQGVSVTSFAFLNASIGKLIMDNYPHVNCINTTHELMQHKIQDVIENAAKSKQCMFCGKFETSFNGKKVKAVQDDSCHWYLIPNDLLEEFDKDNQNESMADSGEFDTKYGQYRTGGSLNNVQLYIE